MKEKLKPIGNDFLSKMPNHIQEYISTDSNKNIFLDLFEATPENVDLRTDLTIQELILVNKIKITDEILETKGLGRPYKDFLNSYMRLKFSLDRKSRGEFVDVNRQERFEQNLKRFGNFANLSKVKE